MAGIAAPLSAIGMAKSANGTVAEGNRLAISLNAYSFDKPLRSGAMNLEDLLEFCSETGFAGADLTGYYFPGYPAPPSDEYIYRIRNRAFRLGIDLGCTGVRNDFTWADKEKRDEEKKLVKDWIMVAHKLGAPGVRIFTGNLSKEEFSRTQRERWIADDILECADFGGKYGVMVTVQNHNDFLRTGADVISLMELIKHEWAGLMLDIGSYRTPDPYIDISQTIKYAVTWQLKELVYINENQAETDFVRLAGIIKSSGYTGYLPLETLGEGDPYTKVRALYARVLSALTR